MARVGRFGIVAGVALAVTMLGVPGTAQAGSLAQEESARPGPAPGPAAAKAPAPTAAAEALPDPVVDPINPAALAITVTPSTGLVTGSSVAVHGTGFPIGLTGVLQCVAGATTLADCDLSSVQIFDTPATGTFDATLFVRRTIRLPDRKVRCWEAPDSCAVAAANVNDQSNFALQTISFDPTVPVPSPSASADPAAGLVDQQSITVSGSGFPPGAPLQLAQCSGESPNCYSGIGTSATVGSDGTFTTPFVVQNRASGTSGVVNCLTSACVVSVVYFEDAEYDVTIPLEFDPNGPQPSVPVISVNPNTDLTDRQLVTVTGEGFDPNTPVAVGQCAVADDGCQVGGNTITQTDTSGAFSTELGVRRNTPRFVPSGVELVDSAANACQISAFSIGLFPLTANAPISFDPDVPADPPPTVTAEPTTDLGYRETVTVQGEGFLPGEQVFVSQCGNDPSGEVGACIGGSGGAADASGAVTITFQARRFVGFDALQDPIDCAVAAGTCELSVFSNDLFESIDIPLSFDPDAPVPPPPTISVDPDTDLGYRQPVSVHATNLAPGDEAMLLQCTDGPEPLNQLCSGMQLATVDASGNVDTEFTVRRTVSNGFDEPVDCSVAPGTCWVQISSSNAPFENAQAPLSFDPNSTIPPPPSLTATPAVGLTDGQTVSIEGSGFTPNAPIGFTLCAEGTLSLNRCDIGRAGFGTADAEGNFAGQLVVTSQISTGEGAVDCAARPGACFIGAANTSDFIENGRAPVTFGPAVAEPVITVANGAVDGATATVAVTLSEPSAGEVRVHWATADGTAVAPADYVAGSGDLLFAPGETAKTITVELVGDASRDADAQFSVQLSAPQGATLDPPDAAATVVLPATDNPPHHEPGHHHNDCGDRWDRHRHHDHHDRDHRHHDHRDHDRDHHDRHDHHDRDHDSHRRNRD